MHLRTTTIYKFEILNSKFNFQSVYGMSVENRREEEKAMGYSISDQFSKFQTFDYKKL